MSGAYAVALAEWRGAESELASIRRTVFVVEQRVPEALEWDGLDAQCVHAVARDERGGSIGTGRLTPEGRIGRMAVLAQWRSRGVGSALLAALVNEARRRGMAAVNLHAQSRAIPFYERFGFSVHGDEFDEAGIPHREMHLDLTGDAS